MRRKQINKVCLNFVLAKVFQLKPKEDKSWTFAVEPTPFAIRFKNKEIAEAFKDAVVSVLSRLTERRKRQQHRTSEPRNAAEKFQS